MGAVRRECRDAVQHCEWISQELRSPAHLAAPSPTISKGAQIAGWAFSGSVASFMYASMERRSASARPSVGSDLRMSNVEVVTALCFDASSLHKGDWQY